jgi:Rad3-related DNA helicase
MRRRSLMTTTGDQLPDLVSPFVVCDEAHNIEDAATSVLKQELSEPVLRRLMRVVHDRTRRLGLLATARKAGLSADDEALKDAAVALADATNHVDNLSSRLRSFVEASTVLSREERRRFGASVELRPSAIRGAGGPAVRESAMALIEALARSEFLGAIGAADLDLEKLVAKIVSASRPSKSVQTVTALARAEPGNGQVQVEVVTPAGLQRPSEKRFGALVHAVLATIDLVATPEVIRQTVSVSARLVDATDQEKEAAVMTVAATLKHPIMMQAAVAARDGEVQRETPIILRRADGTLAEGIVDLAFPENNSGSPRWTVVDFKTGPEFEANRSEYAKQVSLYADAIEKATNLPTRGILLVI